jgi:hypothetical protein
MMHFAKTSGQLERIIADMALQLGETDLKIVTKWRHYYRDSAKLVYKMHVSTGASYMLELLTIACNVKDKMQQVYTK